MRAVSWSYTVFFLFVFVFLWKVIFGIPLKYFSTHDLESLIYLSIMKFDLPRGNYLLQILRHNGLVNIGFFWLCRRWTTSTEQPICQKGWRKGCYCGSWSQMQTLCQGIHPQSPLRCHSACEVVSFSTLVTLTFCSYWWRCKLCICDIVQSNDPTDIGWKDKGTGNLYIKCKEGVDKGTKESKPTILVRNDVWFSIHTLHIQLGLQISNIINIFSCQVGKLLLNALLYTGIKTSPQKNALVAIFHSSVNKSC